MMLDSFQSTLVFESFKVSSPSIQISNKNLSDFEKKVLDFSQEWISKEKPFDFQTSGSTGMPRKITFTRDQIKASAGLTQQTFHLSPRQKAMLCLDPDFIAGKMMIVRALEIGLDLICLDPSADPLKNWKPQPIDFAAMVPYQLEAILKSEDSSKKLKDINTIIIGGSPVSDQLEKKLQSLPTQFFETYGMTETLTHIAIRKMNPEEKAFHILPGVRIFLDEKSCLNIQADHLGPDVIQTNDIVNIVSPNSFQVVGRYDNIINTAGIKVSPETIESQIAPVMQTSFPGIEYFIAGVKDETFGEKITLFFEASDIPAGKKSELLDRLTGLLKKWEVPKDIKCVAQFVRTSSGKVNRTVTSFQ